MGGTYWDIMDTLVLLSLVTALGMVGAKIAIMRRNHQGVTQMNLRAMTILVGVYVVAVCIIELLNLPLDPLTSAALTIPGPVALMGLEIAHSIVEW